MRGKLGQPPPCHARPRLIPACAGKTRPGRRRSGRDWAHPRVCGENLARSPLTRVALGSSPRVRGKPRMSMPFLGGVGLIPACAGKTGHPRKSLPLAAAHPRVCGENSLGLDDAVRPSGSSPRVRGKPRLLTGRGEERGLIPACAGKTPRSSRPTDPAGAHPRVCGENLEQSVGAVNTVGSSPRVRGKPTCLACMRFSSGLIPACAGKTLRARRSMRRYRAHPRVCGENQVP